MDIMKCDLSDFQTTQVKIPNVNEICMGDGFPDSFRPEECRVCMGCL